MTAQPVQPVTLLGATPTYNVAGASDTFVAQPGTRYLLDVKNAGGSACVVKITDPNTQAPVGSTAFDAGVSITVPATTGEKIFIIDSTRFRDGSTGLITLSFTPNASVTYAIITL